MRTTPAIALLLVAGCQKQSAESETTTEASVATAPAPDAMATDAAAAPDMPAGSADPSRQVEDPGEPVAAAPAKPGRP